MKTPSPWVMEAVKQAAHAVFEELGVCHSENVYENSLEVELNYGLWNVGPIRRQVPCEIKYREYVVGTGTIDMLVDESLVIEIKAIAKLTNKDEAQVRKYLLARGNEKGLLINFGPELEIVEVCIKKEGVCCPLEKGEA